MTIENEPELPEVNDGQDLPDETKSLKDQIARLTYEAKKYRVERNQLKEQLSKFDVEPEPEVLPDLKKEEVLNRKWIKEKEKILAERDDIKTRYHDSILDQRLNAAIQKHGGDPFFLKPHLKELVKIEDLDGELDVAIYQNGARTSQSLEDLINNISKEPQYAKVFDGSRANGVPNNRTRSGGAIDWASNPFSDEGWSWSGQSRLQSENPAEASRLKEAARGHNKIQKISEEPRVFL